MTPKTEDPIDAPAAATGGAKRRRRSLWRILARSGLTLVSAFSFVFLALFAGVILSERPFVAPPWLKELITTRLDGSMERLSVDFGEVALIVEDGWKPRLRLRDLTIQRVGSNARLSLSEIQGVLSVAALLEGKARPSSIYLTGAQMRLRRDADGGFDLALGEVGAAQAEGNLPRRARGSDLGALADEIEALLDLPDLRSLERIEATALTLRYEDSRSGRAWTVDGGRAVLERHGNDLSLRGDFALLSGRAWATVLSVSYASKIGSKAAQFGMKFEDMAAEDLATQSAALAWLGVLDAPISGALRAGVDSTGRLGPLNATLQIGEGVLRPNDGTAPLPFRSAGSYFTYDPFKQALTFDELWVESVYLTARAEGDLHLLGTNQGRPSEMVGQLRMTEFSAQPGDLIPEPVAFNDVRADLRLKLDPFVLDVGQLSLGRGDERLTLQAKVRASPEGWDITAEGAMNQIGRDAVLALWPKAMAIKTRDWIEQSVFAGSFHSIQTGFRLRPGGKPDIYIGFGFAEAEIEVVKGLPPAKGVSGHASLYRNRFVAVTETGKITAPQGGRVDLGGTTFVVPDRRIKPAPAEIHLRSDATITASLALLDLEPFRMMAKAGRPVTLADGRLTLAGIIEFVLKKGRTLADYDIALSGNLRDVRSDILLPGRDFAAPDLQVALVGDDLSITGTGRIGTVPVGGDYHANIAPGGAGGARIDGWVEISERFADEFRLGLPPGSLNGKGRAEVAVRIARGAVPEFTMTSDLAGIGLRLTALNWSLPQAARGLLKVDGSFGAPARIDSIAIEAPGLSADGKVTLTEAGQLQTARFDRVKIGTWLDAPVQLSGRGKGATPLVAVTGGWLDLRRTELNGGGSGSAGPIQLALDRLQVSDTVALMDFRGDLTTVGGLQGRFTGLVNGSAQVAGQLIPQGKRSAVRITSADAGRVFSAMKLLKQGRDGAMDLVLKPTGGEGTYDGQLNVRNMRVIEAPVMAALLNSISVVGLVDEMAGRGITFSDVEAQFRLTPRQLIVTQSSAVGASLGISMDGVYDLEAGRMRMQGVISPIYMLNGLGSVFTRKGEGLFGFSYTLSGAAASPKVGVNPLSLLTPGMFREIFRSPPPKISQAPSQ
ncbi:hypothetical protein [Pseudooceanicola sp.]|uniref:hypothetical protein n=1 Tax=Pseudooceanicola sp. TaxID=1914328 RepID=UPI00262977BB|nr:hypothetical protein [Pseudooceanicola sp.]MDF1854317.1 hypothetical protein [Pseudooceanicola sp.]